MSLHKQFATDKAKEKEGVWIDYTAEEGEATPGFKLARMGKNNKAYTKALEAATKPYRRLIELETFSNEQAEKVEKDVFLSTILLDWRNVTDKEGNALSFSKENALALFEDLPELYADLLNNARKAALFRDEEVENDVKN